MPIRSLIAAALAAAASLPAHADTAWQFSYTGFVYSGDNRFQPERSFSGGFRGDDANHDGVLEKNELSWFYWDGIDYSLDGPAYCASLRCELERFSYRLDGQLSFSASWTYSDEHAYSSGSTVSGRYTGTGGWVGDEVSGSSYYWTPATRFEITPPPVPEPAGATMLAAGLLAAGLRRLRSLKPGSDPLKGAAPERGHRS